VTTRDIKDLLLAPQLEREDIQALLAPYGFADPLKADASLQAIADEPPTRAQLARLLEELLYCVSRSADPDLALTYMERFTGAAVHKGQLLAFLESTPATLEILARAFGASPFMGDILVRDPVYLYWLCDPEVLHAERSRGDIEQDLTRQLGALQSEARKLDALRAFKRKETLHIGVRDIARLCSVPQTLKALSTLADVLIQKAYEIADDGLRRSLDLDTDDPRVRHLGQEFVVLGMGKLGGGELNFSSDVDLVYVYANDQGRLPRRRGESISKDEYFARLSRRLTAALSDMTGEGQVYRVDLRLRPEGRIGPVAQSVTSVHMYCLTRGRTWERLAYHKARPVAGNLRLGERAIERIRPFVYGRSLDSAAQEDVRHIKDQIDRQVSERGLSQRDVKLGFGGIREIELVAQSLQLASSRRRPRLRPRNTLHAVDALARARLISTVELETLRGAYLFLRDVENRLQMYSDAQTHVLPDDAAALQRLALSLGFENGAQSAVAYFHDAYCKHTQNVNVVLRRVLYPPTAADRLSGRPR
jgi:glutamate-ammonia-ligase adenylyltransferase